MTWVEPDWMGSDCLSILLLRGVCFGEMKLGTYLVKVGEIWETMWIFVSLLPMLNIQQNIVKLTNISEIILCAFSQSQSF